MNYYKVGAAVAGLLTTAFVSYRVGEEVGKIKATREQKYLMDAMINVAEEHEANLNEAKKELENAAKDTKEELTNEELVFPDWIQQADEIPPFSYDEYINIGDAVPEPSEMQDYYTFLQLHPRTSTEDKDILIMEANEKYRAMMARYIPEGSATKQFLYYLDNFQVTLDNGEMNGGIPVTDQITIENSISERREMMFALGLPEPKVPTWFDLYMWFLRDEDVYSMSSKATELMETLAAYGEDLELDIDDPEQLSRILDSFSYGEILDNNLYSPFGLTAEEYEFLVRNHRNTLDGQRNEWLSPMAYRQDY